MLSSLALYLQNYCYTNWYCIHVQWFIWSRKPTNFCFSKRMFSRAPNDQMIYVLISFYYSCDEHMIICNICVYIYVYMVGHYVYIVYTSTYIGTWFSLWSVTTTLDLWLQQCVLETSQINHWWSLWKLPPSLDKSIFVKYQFV